MTDIQALEDRAAALKTEIKDTRARRIAAQKSAAAEITLRKALDQAQRDRSSSTTDEIESIKGEIETTRRRIVDKSFSADWERIQFAKLDKVYPNNPQRENLIEALNAEARWRAEHNAKESTRVYDLALAPAEEIS